MEEDSGHLVTSNSQDEPPEYVLDTSALIAVGASVLSGIGKNHKLCVSPVSLWEVLSHLDDGDTADKKHKGFLRCRGIIRKTQLMELLDDPFTEHHVELGAEALVNVSRLEEPELLRRLVKIIDDSESLDDFYRRDLFYPGGGSASLSNLGQAIKQERIKEKARYRAHIVESCGALLEDLGCEAAQQISPVDIVNVSISTARDMAKKLESELTGESISPGEAFSSVFLHCAYKTSRCGLYLKATNCVPENVAIDKNDCEDSQIVFHLGLTTRRVLVCGDVGQRSSVEEAIASLGIIAEQVSLPVAALCKAIGIEEFVALA